MFTTAAFTLSYTSTTSSRRLPGVRERLAGTAAGGGGGGGGGGGRGVWSATAANPTAAASPVGSSSRRRVQRRRVAMERVELAGRIGAPVAAGPARPRLPEVAAVRAVRIRTGH